MGMKSFPQITTLPDGSKCWAHTFDSFKVKVFVPQGNPLADIVNFGFMAPYLLIFEEAEMTMEQAVSFARAQGFDQIAAQHSTSVVFVSPVCEGGWAAAPRELFVDLIAESRINQYFRDGVVTSRDRFTGQWGDCFIRGAIFRSFLYGYGPSADFIARNYLQTVDGQFLWGPGEITPAAVTLERLSVLPAPARRDIPVVSVGNAPEINASLQAGCDHVLIQQQSDVPSAYAAFVSRHKRWCGILEDEPTMEELGLVEEADFALVSTASDNRGDDKDTQAHRIGYLAYYNRGLMDNGPVPLLLAFHGGGDSAYYITHVSGWHRVAMRHNFLLVAVENHLNSTATEMIQFIDELKKKYPIDEKRIYASGFSMGGIKSWDLYQEYPQVFAALAPMSATVEVGHNVYFRPVEKEINHSVPVPLFYAGGEITPLPELPFQAEKCWDRLRYVFEVNQLQTPYSVRFEDKESWPDPIWGISGDQVEKIDDPSRGSVLTINYFQSHDGVIRTAFASISGQGHECREHTCEHAWRFMSQFTR